MSFVLFNYHVSLSHLSHEMSFCRQCLSCRLCLSWLVGLFGDFSLCFAFVHDFDGDLSLPLRLFLSDLSHLPSVFDTIEHEDDNTAEQKQDDQ